VELDGAIELHAAFRKESRTSLPSVSAARRKSGKAKKSFVVPAGRDHSSRTFLDHSNCETALAEGSGRPLGTAEFVTGLERLLGRPIARRAPGRKPTAGVTGVQLKLLQ
jgi:hypothetical protein